MPSDAARLRAFAMMLVDQSRARVIVSPLESKSGFWFGGGNMIEDEQGSLWLVGRYRNQGDSRTGVGAGDRGLELAVFCSSDRGQTFRKVTSFSKSRLSYGTHQVLSIEGSALRKTARGVELYVSTEKTGIDYPEELASYLKPGTGVWTIDRLTADSVEGLADADVEPLLSCHDPRFLQVKDPFLWESDGGTHLLFCTHPYCWTSSNTGYVRLDEASQLMGEPCFDFFPRGFTWDVAMTRGTAVLDVPRVGAFKNRDCRLLFYDGGECLRNLDEHSEAVKRPRGYSCEELGGVAAFEANDLGTVERLSRNQPMFLSPHGTGCSRYVDVLATADGYYVTWQQSQADLSQPLVMNFVSTDEASSTL